MNSLRKQAIRHRKHLAIGRYTYGDAIRLHCGESKCYIGSFCSVADGVEVYLGWNHDTRLFTTYPMRHFLGVGYGIVTGKQIGRAHV